MPPIATPPAARSTSRRLGPANGSVVLVSSDIESFLGSRVECFTAEERKRRATQSPEGYRDSRLTGDADGSANAQGMRKECLLMPSALIFASSVERGMPSLAAAPEGPATRPCVSASA